MATTTTTTTTERKNVQVLVVGAGLAGLTAAARLHEQGVDVLVLEASSRIGGRVNSVSATTTGSRLDLGGQWIGHDHHRLTALVKEANGTIVKTFSTGLPRIVHRGRTLSPFSPSILLGAIYLVFFELVSRLYVPRRWNSLTLERAISGWVPAEATRQFLRFLTAISATAELDLCSVYALAKSVPLSGGLVTILGSHGGAQDSLVVESVGVVVSMLARQLDTRVATGTPVTSVYYGESGVEVQTASGQHFGAERVIITIPPPMLKEVSFEPPLPAERQNLQRNTRMGVVYKAIAVFERPFWRDSVGGEFIMLDDPACAFFDTSPPEGCGHLCLLVPGTPARQLDELDVAQRRQQLLARLVPFMGPEVLNPLEWHEKAWHLDEFCGGGYLAFPAVGTVEGLMPMPHQPTGRIHWAGTETAQEHPGYIEGAIQSGQRVASEVALALKKPN